MKLEYRNDLAQKNKPLNIFLTGLKVVINPGVNVISNDVYEKIKDLDYVKAQIKVGHFLITEYEPTVKQNETELSKESVEVKESTKTEVSKKPVQENVKKESVEVKESTKTA
jgi:DNA-binding transcriptional regulator YhcF (GntR family)